MGIQGLLPQLKSVTARAHVSKFRGKRAAIDAYVLLHRGAYTCAREICEGEPTDRCTEYCMGRIQLLLSAGVVPVVVFDGGRLPNKDDEERNRARSREENKAKARALWQQGNRTAAFECYQRAVDISPAVAKGFIDALKRRSVDFIVAPYEADAQMAYLAINGLVDVVITEDSDLLTYGCPRVFFKMDKSGEGEEIELENLVHARELSFIGFTHDMFQEMCILAGCDFVKALPGIGIKKAHQQIRQRKSFVKVIKNLRFSGTPVPQDYERRVQRAIWTFQHQRVYCPQRRAVVHLHELKGDHLAHGALVPSAAELLDGEDDFLGPELADDVAQAIAAGELDPITQQPYGAVASGKPCTAPQQQDGPTHAASQSSGDRSAVVQDSLRQIMEGLDGGASQGQQGRRQQQQQQQGQHRAKGSSGAGAADAGNALAQYGFLRASGSARKEFRRPRMNGELDEGQQQAAAAAQQQQQEPQASGSQHLSSPAYAAAGGSLQAGQAGSCAMAAADDGRLNQAFLQMLQAAGPMPVQQFGVGVTDARGNALCESWHSQQPAHQRPAAVLPVRAGVSGLMAKLRADLREPGLDELLHQRPASTGGVAGAAAAAPASPGSRRPQPHSPTDLGLQPSPTIDDLMDAGAREPAERIPDSPQFNSLGAAPAQQQPVQQITPGFYGVSESEEQPDGMLMGLPPGSPGLGLGDEEDALGLATEEAEAGGDAISSLEHVHAFAQEAKAAMDRVAVQAVRDTSIPTLRMQPPAYLQRHQQQLQSVASLKRPFSVPRAAGDIDKENAAAGAPGSKRRRPEPHQRAPNLFSKFVCK